MKIEYVNTNLMYMEDKYIAHGVNCMGVMGAGVARAIRSKYPNVYAEYVTCCTRFKDNPKELLGSILMVKSGSKVIINCFTQLSMGLDHRQVDYDAVRSCMKEINDAASNGLTDLDEDMGSIYEKIESDDGLVRVAMPKIGAGLGGGDWSIIEKIIEEESHNFQPVVSQIVK